MSEKDVKAKIDATIEAAANWWVSVVSGKASTESILKFKESLVSWIGAELARYSYCALHCDYSPEGKLALIAFESGILGSAFPKKVLMDVSFSEVGLRKDGKNREVIYKS